MDQTSRSRWSAAAAIVVAATSVTIAYEGGGAARADEPANGRLLVADGVSPGFVTVNPDGTGLGSLQPTGGGLSAGDMLAAPHVSPDGRHLVFQDHTTMTIWVSDVDGANAHQVSFPGAVAIGGPGQQTDYNPVWADDSTILFARQTSIYNSAGDIVVDWNATIMSVGIAGGAEMVWLANSGNDKQIPLSSSDNGVLLYQGPDAQGRWAYFVTDTATHAQTRQFPIQAVSTYFIGDTPALSPDGTHVLLDDDNGSASKTHIDSIDGSSDSTVVNTAASGLTWSPDGRQIAFTWGDTSSNPAVWVQNAVAGAPMAKLPTGSGYWGTAWLPGTATPAPPTSPPSTPPTSPPSTPPSTPPGGGPKVYRDAGSDRVGTGIAVSEREWAQAGSAKAVVLATSLNFPDALSGGPLAAKKGGPLLLTDGSATRLDPRVRSEIQRVLPAGGAVYVLGGDSAVSPGIVAQLKSLGYAVTQFKGRDRADTALRVAVTGMGSPQHVVLATGTGFADALAAGPYAAGPFADADGSPAAIVLSDGGSLDAATAGFLHGRTVATVGGPAGRAWPGAVESFAGRDRFATAALVAAQFTGPYANTQVGIANGVASAANPGYPDALTGGAFMAESKGPIVLVDGIGDVVPPATRAVLAARTGNARADIFGGTAIISPAVAASIVSLLHGTAQF